MHASNVSDYGLEILRIRRQLGLTQLELADVLGVTANSVMRYENGFRNVPEPVIRLARHLVRLKMP